MSNKPIITKDELIKRLLAFAGYLKEDHQGANFLYLFIGIALYYAPLLTGIVLAGAYYFHWKNK